MIKLAADVETPIYVKTGSEAPWPSDEVFFMLTGDGLFLCRNHEFFTSSVPAPNPPCDLEPHRGFLRLHYPKIPRKLMEQAVGFFHAVYKRYSSEAGLLLVWNPRQLQLRLLCPRQEATISRSWSGTYPVGLHYEIPDLGEDLLIGDLHSHADEPAYASHTDKLDERNRGAGIHVVVGRLGEIDRGGQIDLHVDGVVDGTRFKVPHRLIIEDYRQPGANVPRRWMDRIWVTDCGTGSTDDPCRAARDGARGDAAPRSLDDLETGRPGGRPDLDGAHQ